MTALTTQRQTVLPPPAAELGHPEAVRWTKRLIYLYLILIVFEGVLRKWVVPGLSDPLLVIRDPVVLAIYYFALRARVFPNNIWILLLAIFGIPSALLTLVTLYSYFPFKAIVLTAIYGFRSNFLHLPLIFVMANVLDLEDVKKIGWWTIVGLIPMAVLMALQFHASPDSFINRTAGLGGGEQIATSGGKIRPPGTFSFISGPIFYLAASTAFLLYAALSKLQYRTWLLFAGGLSLIVGAGVSGSRGAVLAVVLVVAMLGVILLVRPDAITKFGRNLFLVALVLWAVSWLPIFREGVRILSERFTDSAEVAETSVLGGIIQRMAQQFTEPLSYFGKIPLTGYGLGLGTAGGARFLTGTGTILLTENEWGRLIAESGPILGLAFIFWRVALAGKLVVASLRALRLGEALPILLLACAFLAVLNGPLGQPTALGFTVVLAGLCLAATNFGEDSTSRDEKEADEKSEPKPLPRRSVFADRIHNAARPTDHTNGSVDR